MALKKEFRLENRLDEFMSLYAKGLSDREIGEEMKVFRKTIGLFRTKLGLTPNKRFPLDSIKNKFLILYKEGYTDAQIAKKLGFTRSGIEKFRHKLNLKVNKPISDNDKIVIKELETLGYSKEDIDFYINQNRKTENINNFTEKELAIIIGILLGDGNIQYLKEVRNKNACFTTQHSPKQKLYSIHIATQLKRLYPRIHYCQDCNVDIKTGKSYSKYIVRFHPSRVYNDLYKIFYPNGIKVIPDFVYNHYTAESLAYQYMDDGFKMESSYKIATHCFTLEDLHKFQYFLLTKFNLETTIHKDHSLYVRRKSADLFKQLIEPYIIDSMKYKLY